LATRGRAIGDLARHDRPRLHSATMKIAHVREVNAPTGAPWRLAAALGIAAAKSGSVQPPTGWLDLEVARRRAVAGDPRLAHNSVLHRVPVTTLDDHLAAGLRVAALADLVDGFVPRDDGEDDDAVVSAADLHFGPPLLRPPSLRDFYAFEGHVRTMWERRGGEVPEAWYRLPIFYFSNTSEIHGPGDPIWSPAASAETIGGYTIFNDWSARDLQREETTVRLGPAKGKDFASTFGPWLVTPDELVDARAGGASGPDLVMTAEVNGDETSRGRWSDAHFSFGDMLARASADVRLRAGDLIGSGTVGTGCLLEVRDATLGRYLQPGDVVTLTVERLGSLTNPIVERPR